MNLKWLKTGILCVLSIGCIIGSWVTGYRLTGEAFCFLVSAFWVEFHEHLLKKYSDVKGIIQFDKEHYDIPAMRFAFYEEPLNLMNYDEVTFKVDKNATIEPIDTDVEQGID